jgi:hypothetical protein
LRFSKILFPPSQYCTSLRYHVTLSCVKILNLSSLSYCIFYYDLFFMQNLRGTVYSSKLSIRTSYSCCLVLLVIAILYSLLRKLFLYIFTRDRVYSCRDFALPKVEPYTSRRKFLKLAKCISPCLHGELVGFFRIICVHPYTYFN